jgi:hypothetical protein
MRTATANIDFIANVQAAGSDTWNSRSESFLGAISGWLSAVAAKAQIANLPAYLVVDAFGADAALRIDSNVRDGFGRPVY